MQNNSQVDQVIILVVSKKTILSYGIKYHLLKKLIKQVKYKKLVIRLIFIKIIIMMKYGIEVPKQKGVDA